VSCGTFGPTYLRLESIFSQSACCSSGSQFPSAGEDAGGALFSTSRAIAWRRPCFNEANRERSGTCGGCRAWFWLDPGCRSDANLASTWLSHPCLTASRGEIIRIIFNGLFYGRQPRGRGQNGSTSNKIGTAAMFITCVPGTNSANFLCVAFSAALGAGGGSIHLEEPEFWVAPVISEASNSEWPTITAKPGKTLPQFVDSQWRSSNSNISLSLPPRIASRCRSCAGLQSKITAPAAVEVYVPTHSLLKLRAMGIVSPEST